MENEMNTRNFWDEVKVEEPMPCEVKEKRVSLKERVKRNRNKIITGAIYGAYLGALGLITIRGIKQTKAFNRAFSAKYGENVSEGCIFGGKDLKALWDQHDKYEEEYKGNFEKIRDAAKGLKLKSGEYYILDRCTKDGKLVTELVQNRDGGWWHGELW